MKNDKKVPDEDPLRLTPHDDRRVAIRPNAANKRLLRHLWAHCTLFSRLQTNLRASHHPIFRHLQFRCRSPSLSFLTPVAKKKKPKKKKKHVFIYRVQLTRQKALEIAATPIEELSKGAFEPYHATLPMRRVIFLPFTGSSRDGFVAICLPLFRQKENKKTRAFRGVTIPTR